MNFEKTTTALRGKVAKLSQLKKETHLHTTPILMELQSESILYMTNSL